MIKRWIVGAATAVALLPTHSAIAKSATAADDRTQTQNPAQSPAQLQDQRPPASASPDNFTIGVGVAVSSRYDGSGDSALSPGAVVRGRVGPVSFATVGTGLVTDLIPSSGPKKLKLVAGPIAQLRLGRASLKRLRDPQVRALGKIGVTAELGGQIGLSKTGVLTPRFDTLSTTIAITHDVGSVHRALIVTPQLTYGSPISRKAYIAISIKATHVGRGYAQRYFGITPAQALVSDLPGTTINGGWKDAGGGVFGSVSLTGDLRRGLSLFAGGNYSRLQGQFARSPIVKARNQRFGVTGLALSF
jgi:MipA family protein